MKGAHLIDVLDERGNLPEPTPEIKDRCIGAVPPIDKKRRYPKLTLTVIHAQERQHRKDR